MTWAGTIYRPVVVYMTREDYFIKCAAIGVSRRRAASALRDATATYLGKSAEELCARAWCVLAEEWASDAG